MHQTQVPELPLLLLKGYSLSVLSRRALQYEGVSRMTTSMKRKHRDRCVSDSPYHATHTNHGSVSSRFAIRLLVFRLQHRTTRFGNDEYVHLLCLEPVPLHRRACIRLLTRSPCDSRSAVESDLCVQQSNPKLRTVFLSVVYRFRALTSRLYRRLQLHHAGRSRALLQPAPVNPVSTTSFESNFTSFILERIVSLLWPFRMFCSQLLCSRNCTFCKLPERR